MKKQPSDFRSAMIKSVTVFLLSGLLLEPTFLAAQSTAQKTLIGKIYAAYDSLDFLTFDVKFIYNSDTLNGEFINDVLDGTYTLAGKKSKYNIGDVEFMQNDSFLVAVYNEDKTIVVTDPKKTDNASGLPIRATIDSLLASFEQYYTYNATVSGDTGTLSFNKSAAGAQFLNFSITYDTLRKTLYSVEYVFVEMADSLANETEFVQAPRKKHFKVAFSNYRFDNFSDALYDEERYVFLENGEWKPAEKYSDFRVFYSRTSKSSNVAPPL